MREYLATPNGVSGIPSVVKPLLLIMRVVKLSTIQLSADIGRAFVGVNGSGTLWWSPNLGSGGEYQLPG